MKERIHDPENVVEYTIKKYWKHTVLVMRKILRTETLVSEEQHKIYWYFYEILLFVAKKSRFNKNQQKSRLLNQLGIKK